MQYVSNHEKISQIYRKSYFQGMQTNPQKWTDFEIVNFIPVPDKTKGYDKSQPKQ